MSIQYINDGDSGLLSRTIINQLVDVSNNVSDNISSSMLSPSQVGGTGINLGIGNNLRSSLGISVGGINYNGGELFPATLESGSSEIYVSDDVTSYFSLSNFIYITSLDTAQTVERQIGTVTYTSGITTMSIDSSIDDTSTSVVISSNAYGINTLNVGNSNTAVGNNSVNIGSYNLNTRYANSSLSLGKLNICNDENTIVQGYSGLSNYSNSRVLSGDRLNNFGDCQSTEIIAGIITTGSAIQEVLLYDNQKIYIPSDTAYKFHIETIALQTTGSAGLVGDCYSEDVYGLITNINGTTKIIGQPNITNIFDSQNPTVWTVDVSADDVNDSLLIRVTGEANKTIKWVFKITFVETKI